MRRLLSSIRLILGFAFQADRRTAILAFTLWGVFTLSTVIFALWLKLVVDGVVKRSLFIALAGAVGLTLSLVVQGLTNWIGSNMINTLAEKTSLLIDQKLIHLSSGLPGIEHHERPEYLKEMDLLRSERWRISASVSSVVSNFGTLIQTIATSVLLAFLHPLLLLLPLFGIPSLIAAGKWQRMNQKTAEETVEQGRLSGHLFQLTTTASPGMELRIFGLADELIGRHQRIWRETDIRRNRTSLLGASLSALGWMVFALGYAAAIGFVVLRAVRGLATAGDVVMAVSLASQVNLQVSQAAGGVSWMMRSLKAIERYLWLVEYEKKAQIQTIEPRAVPETIRKGIDLENLSFRYPDTDADVVQDVNLHIPAGSRIAIVGDNGAGKTTLIKLLSRFYEPTEGRILIDGLSLHSFDVEEWRRHIAAGFQDFVRFEFLARETVGVGDLRHVEEAPIVEGALVRAGSEDVVASLPKGLESQLGKTFEDGTDLSTGQWQKLALGRAMMQELPLLLILDEPTASLDAVTEHALFERYFEAAGRLSVANGGITMLVSHRFSTVRMADLIVVVDGGRIVEKGSHHELVSNAGIYAELFEIQARAYR